MQGERGEQGEKGDKGDPGDPADLSKLTVAKTTVYTGTGDSSRITHYTIGIDRTGTVTKIVLKEHRTRYREGGGGSPR